MSSPCRQFFELGQTCFNRGDYDSALRHFGEVIACARAEGNTVYELRAMSWIPVVLFNASQWEATIRASRQFQERARELGQPHQASWAKVHELEARAKLDLRTDWPELKAELLEGVRAARAADNSYRALYQLVRLGGYAARVGEFEQARAWLEEALAGIDRRASRSNYLLYNIYAYLCRLMLWLGKPAEARRHARRCRAAAEKEGNLILIADADLCLAQAECDLGHAGRALNIAEQVLSQSLQLNWGSEEGEAQVIRAEVFLATGRVDKAVHAAQRAVEVAGAVHVLEDRVKCLILLGRARLAQRRPDEARYALGEAQRLAAERNYDDHVRTAERLIADMTGPRH